MNQLFIKKPFLIKKHCFLESKGQGSTNDQDQDTEPRPSTSTTTEIPIPIQSGSGIDVFQHIADLVAEKLGSNVPAYQNFNLGPPAPIISANPDTKPQGSFEVNKTKDDLNSKFDEKELLKCVPPTSRRLAQILLEQFNLRGNELTWMPDGTILIDETSIPKSNIFIIFPLLFKASKKSSKPPGYFEFIEKLNQMGLDHLVKTKLSKAEKRPINHQRQQNSTDGNISEENSTPSKREKWWYLG